MNNQCGPPCRHSLCFGYNFSLSWNPFLGTYRNVGLIPKTGPMDICAILFYHHSSLYVYQHYCFNPTKVCDVLLSFYLLIQTLLFEPETNIPTVRATYIIHFLGNSKILWELNESMFDISTQEILFYTTTTNIRQENSHIRRPLI